ncbi:hypothetical protein RSAG8_13436, partial [Rhizoctonia solani AG-8 WAC10335]
MRFTTINREGGISPYARDRLPRLLGSAQIEYDLRETSSRPGSSSNAHLASILMRTPEQQTLYVYLEKCPDFMFIAGDYAGAAAIAH